MKRLLITICGRAGSKGFKNKNLKNFCGKPLVYYSLSAAELFIRNHPELEVDIALNTDSEDLANLVPAEYPEDNYLPRGAAQGGGAPGTGRGAAAARQRIGRVGQDEMEGIFAAVPQKMRVGKVALPEAAHIFQPQKAGVCRGRSA